MDSGSEGFVDNLRNDGAADNMDVTELVQSRMENLKQKQIARRAAWLEQTKAELEKRAEHKREMEGIPRNQVADKDKQTLSKISKKWRNKFLNERTQFLFTEVFPIFCKQSFDPDDAVKLCKDAEIHAEALSFVLRCRLVCESWKEVVDERLSIHNSTGLPFCNGLPHCAPLLNSVDQLTSFNLWSDQTCLGRNPFFTREFLGGSCTGEWRSDAAYWNETEKTLRRWGGELWTFVVKFDKGSLEMMYIFLCKYLSLTPNLRRLCFLDRDRSGSLEVDMRRELGQDVFGPLKSRMERSPLPELPHLRAISFGEYVPAPLVQAALAKYGSLEFVVFVHVGYDKFTGGYMDPGEFVSGKPLPLQKYICCYGTTSQEVGSQTTQISHWNYQLPFLNKLNLEYIDVQDGAEVGNIFKTVNSCGSTLRRLRLLFNFIALPPPVEARSWHDRLPEGVKLELPHLEELELYIIHSKITHVDFLLPLVSLKKIIFSYDAMKADDSVENGKGIIQFAGYRDRLYESNLWKLLPELRLVTLKTVPMIEQCTRMKIFGREITIPMEEPKKTTVYDRDGYRKYLNFSGRN